ncbi:MAG TPA: DUF1853 family protein, partial [Halioglobus sp.]
MIINYPYQTQEVRDLAWACFSPSPLNVDQLAGASSGIATCFPPLTPERKLWLERLDNDPTALLEHLAQRHTHRLGVYFEQLWHFFLQQDCDTELVAHNLPVCSERRILGEFDCIYYCHQRNCHVHLELAVKFYLGIPRAVSGDTAGYLYEWLGPDRQDRLDIKLQQLLQHQILLGEHPAAKQTLKALGIGDLAREVVLKGYLFQPDTAIPPFPPGYNPQCVLQRWVECQKLRGHCATTEAESYVILPKRRWLCPARCLEPGELLIIDQL